MFSSYQSSPAIQSVASPSASLQAAWSADLDDMAFGCECADPALQIACWSQESTPGVQVAAAAD